MAAGQPDSIEDTHHIVFDCPLYAPERSRWPSLFEPPVLESVSPLHAFFQQPADPLYRFCAAVRRRGRVAGGMAP